MGFLWENDINDYFSLFLGSFFDLTVSLSIFGVSILEGEWS